MVKFDRTSEAESALCLSGGGYRAALFHLGAIRRLNELGVLSRIAIVSSVSGGSILNGLLAGRWNSLIRDGGGVFQNFDEQVGQPLRQFCATDIRTNLIIGHRLNPVNWFALANSLLSVSGNTLARSYQSLFGGTLLQALPSSGVTTPRFVFCATSMNTGACWHFHSGPEGRMGDFYTGYAPTDDVSLAEAVAASSAFPLAFAPFLLYRSRMKEISRVDPWGQLRPLSGKRRTIEYETIHLTDGGVYDNLGVEPVWSFMSTLLSSDGGLPFESVATCPPYFVSRLQRAASISNEQVGAVRKRWLIERFVAKARRGALWAINTNIEDYQLSSAPGYGSEGRQLLSGIRTDLNSFSEAEIACLENHGYSLADAALKSRAPQLLVKSIPEFVWPHPDWSADAKTIAALQNSASRHITRDIRNWLTGAFRRLDVRSRSSRSTDKAT
jgi:NTE family protein